MIADWLRRAWKTVVLVVYFLFELVVASLRVLWEVITPAIRSRPGIVAVPLDAKTDIEITFLANFVSLTPGTLSLEVSADRRTLFVHAMFVDEAEDIRREVKEGVERRLLEAMRCRSREPDLSPGPSISR